MVEGINQNGVLSGLAVSQHAAGADMSVDVAAGSALIDEEKYIETSVTNLVIDASESGKHRKDTIIYDTATSAPAVIKGTSVAITSAAVPPSVTDGDILLAVVYIGDSVTEITDSDIYDGRIFITAIKDNWTATTDPDNNDDTNSGYEIGSRWVNTTKRSFFVCTDATAGAAVWRGTYSSATSPATTDDEAHGYTIGSQWIDTVADKEFVCVDATAGNAIWIETTSQLQEDFLEIIRQMHPNVSVLAAIDDAALKFIILDGTVYKLSTAAVYDEHNDNSVDTTLWDVVEDSDCSVTEENNEYLKCYAYPPGGGSTESAYVTSTEEKQIWVCRLYEETGSSGGWSDHTHQIIAIGSDTHTYDIDGTYHVYAIEFDGANCKIYKDEVEVLSEADSNTSGKVKYLAEATPGSTASEWSSTTVYVDYTRGDHFESISSSCFSDALAANADVLSFYSHLKGKFSNGGSTASDPVEVEIYGDGDSYAAALNGTTKLKIDPTDPIIELYRIDDSVVAKSDAQTDWVLDDNSTNGAFPAKTTSTHETIFAEEIGCASVVMLEKSVNGAFTDTELLVEDDDYTIDYSTRTAAKIILTTSAAADIVNAQSKLRITWIVDVESIDGTANTALKMKIYLNRTDTTEASPEIQPIDLGTGKYAEMKYMCG